VGAKTQRAIAYQQQTAGQAAIATAEQSRQYNERVYGSASQMLGTDEQVAGYGEDSKLQGYTGRYTLDQGILGSLRNSSTNLVKDKTFGTKMQGQLDAANSLMEQSEAAARAGNWDEAERLRTQAEGGLGGGMNASFKSAFRLGGGAVDAKARGLLTGPQAQIVGQQVKQAREFQDWGSQGSQDWRARMSESGERSIATEAQSALRQARDFGLQRGAGRMAGAASAINADTLRRASTQRAQVHSDVNAAFENFRHSFAQGAVSFAQSWLSGQAGIRDQFQDAMTNIQGMTAQMYGQGSELATKFASMAQEEDQANQAKRGALYGTAVSLAAGVAGFALGGPAGAAALGSAASSAQK
jgi:hypothetical protein